jgi:heat shock protein HtpX
MVRSKDSANTLHTILLIFALAVLAGFVGFVLGGRMGLIGAVLFTVFGFAMGSRASAALVLRMYKAQPIHPGQAPQLFEIYNELCRRAELSPYPKLYYIPTRMPNAFAVGVGDSSAVAVTDGIIRMMNPREIAGILAHEITHVQCRDTSVLGVADIFSRTISVMSRIGLLMMFFSFSSFFGDSPIPFWVTGAILFFSPTVAVMLQLALSRTREFNADKGAAELTGDPYGLASALKKLDRLAQGGMLQKILRPGMRRQQPAMLRTHPPTEDRVDALMEVAKDLEANESLPQLMMPPQRRIPPADRPKVRQRPRYRFLSGIWR